MFFNNGILIQDIDREATEFTKQIKFTDAEFENFRAYRGLGRYYRSWPLSLENDNLSRQLTAETEKWFVTYNPDKTPTFNFEIVPEKKFCNEYIKHCQEKGIKIRILFCRTEIEKPSWNSLLPELSYLGFDYSTPIPYYSSIPEDLLDPVKKYLYHPLYNALVQCGEKLNNNKLFNNEIDIRTYIEKRKRVMESDIQWSMDIIDGQEYKAHLVEPDCDFTVIQLSEVIGDL